MRRLARKVSEKNAQKTEKSLVLDAPALTLFLMNLALVLSPEEALALAADLAAFALANGVESSPTPPRPVFTVEVALD